MKNVTNFLKHEKIIFAAWNAENQNDNPYQNWYLPLRDTFGKVIVFDTASQYFRYGKQEMNHQLKELIKKENPNYLFLLMIYDEIDPLILQHFQSIAPKMIILSLFPDDDWRYEDYSRYYGLFIHYPIINITDKNMERFYVKDDIRHFSLSLGMNCSLFRPLDLEKKYDVSFVGRPNASRADYVGFLLEKKVKINVWGDGWQNYPKIASAYSGNASADDLVRITNQSKINLSFTQGGYGKMQMKGRVFEISACRGFSLVENFETYADYFKKGKELVMFKDKDELLSLIYYYLKHEKERENIASAAHLRTLRDYNKHRELLKYFQSILTAKNELLGKRLPHVGKVAVIHSEDINNEKKIKNILGEAEYVAFSSDAQSHPLQHYLQAYALEKTGKAISCCDYYVSAKGLPNYILFKAKQAFMRLNRNDFARAIKISQLVVRKKYFLQYRKKFQEALQGKSFPLDERTVTFVSLPLLSVKELPALSPEAFRNAFQMKCLDALYSLYYQKKLLLRPYPYFLALKAILNSTIRKALIENIDRKKLAKLKQGI